MPTGYSNGIPLKPPSNLGKHHSNETKLKIGKANKGREKTPEQIKKHSDKMRGRKLSEETKRKISISNGGTGISEKTSKRYYHLLDYKYKEWRSAVFQRDNWTCQTCGVRSSEGNQVYLEPHHIKGWAKYEDLRYEVDNGITLCKECHKLTRKKKV